MQAHKHSTLLKIIVVEKQQARETSSRFQVRFNNQMPQISRGFRVFETQFLKAVIHWSRNKSLDRIADLWGPNAKT
jgi:hypothetical protein